MQIFKLTTTDGRTASKPKSKCRNAGLVAPDQYYVYEQAQKKGL
jgi:hypothetical protein